VNTREILEALGRGELTVSDAEQRLTTSYLEELGHSTIDHHRSARNGAAEVVYGGHKTPAQIADACAALAARSSPVLVTRASPAAYAEVHRRLPEASYHEQAALVTFRPPGAPAPAPVTTRIAVVSAGTSDLPVAEEAALTAEFYGNPVDRINDVGVAGIHRLLARVAEIRAARVVVVVAGMEGALPSAVGGLVDKPVIAVPTSVGYGAAFGGVAALLGMLNSCASGVSVVNIDNGFGAGYLASMINRLDAR